MGLYNINGELYEAAAIDGANGWDQFAHSHCRCCAPSLPWCWCLRPACMGTAGGVADHVRPHPAGPENAGMLVGRYSYDIAFYLGDMRWGYAAAINLTMGVVSMVMAVHHL